MRIRDAISFLVFGVIIATALSYMWIIGVDFGEPRDRMNISMTVADINGLEKGSSVLLRGVMVGKVTDITATTAGAKVQFYLRSGERIPVDSEVRLENLSALGEAYVSFKPRVAAGPFLGDGETIATESVSQTPSVSELATNVVHALNQMDPGQLERIVNQGEVALPDPDDVLPNLTRTSDLLRTTVFDLNGEGRALLDNLQLLLRNAQWVAPAFAALALPVRNTGLAAARFFATAGPIVFNNDSPRATMLISDLVRRLQLFMEARSPDLKVLGQSLLPQVNAIAASLMNIDMGQILTNMLAAVPEDGAITLRVAVQPNG